MFQANIVFADINGHSDMPLGERAAVLDRFWKICESHKPHDADSYSMSFYDIDNDSLMAGFSGMRKMESASDALAWTVKLRNDLASNGVPTSFGVALSGLRYQVDWEALPGLLPELRSHLYFPDELEALQGRVDRRRLAGDPLILAARLLSLAKTTKAAVAFAFVPTDQHRYESIKDVQTRLRQAGEQAAIPLSRQLRELPPKHSHWLERWHIEPYGLFEANSGAHVRTDIGA
jgi:hypothetical protein